MSPTNQIGAVLKQIALHKNVRHLNTARQDFTTTRRFEFMEAISSNKGLQSLNIRARILTAADVESILALPELRSLQINFSNNLEKVQLIEAMSKSERDLSRLKLHIINFDGHSSYMNWVKASALVQLAQRVKELTLTHVNVDWDASCCSLYTLATSVSHARAQQRDASDAVTQALHNEVLSRAANTTYQRKYVPPEPSSPIATLTPSPSKKRKTKKAGKASDDGAYTR